MNTELTAKALSQSARRLALAFERQDARELARRRADLLAVHGALARGRLGERDWTYLKRRLPPLHWWRSWDRCERLRRAAVALAARRAGGAARLAFDADARTAGQFARTRAAVLTGASGGHTL